jgi:thiamine-phosphate pyrophosphorylase
MVTRTASVRLQGLYLILDPSVAAGRSLTDILKEAAEAGAQLFQYRDKQASMRDAYRQALALKQAAVDCGALLIVNDRCDLAQAVDADGVHLGQDDLLVTDARRLLGPGKLIGLSTHNPDQVTVTASQGPDYLGFGPIFATATKRDHDPVVGLDGLRKVRALTNLPIFAIGGISLEAVKQVREAGADGAAIVSAVLTAPNIGEAVRAFLKQLS